MSVKLEQLAFPLYPATGRLPQPVNTWPTVGPSVAVGEGVNKYIGGEVGGYKSTYPYLNGV